MRSHTVAALIALCFLTGTRPAQAATPKACDLLDVQTATALLGMPVGTPVDKGGLACTYTAKSGNTTVSLGAGDSPDKDAVHYVEVMQAFASRDQGTTTKSIPGLGEQSFLATRTSNKNYVLVTYHQKLVILSVQRPMTPDLEKAMLQFTRQVLGKL